MSFFFDFYIVVENCDVTLEAINLLMSNTKTKMLACATQNLYLGPADCYLYGCASSSDVHSI